MPRNHIKAGGDRTLFCLGKNSKSLFLWTSKFHYLKCPLSTWWILYSFFSPKSRITSSAKSPLTLQVAIITHSLCNLCFVFIILHCHLFIYLAEHGWMTCSISAETMPFSSVSLQHVSQWIAHRKFPVQVKLFIVSCKPCV